MNMEDAPIFSIVMPVYNSEMTLGKALESIRMQTFDQTKIEILVIDGGSTDKTIKIAHEYNTTVLINKDRLPEPAKCIGIQKCKGRYLIEMDSDEAFISPTQLALRHSALLKFDNAKLLLADRAIPPEGGGGVSCSYLISIGDPFSYFVNGLTGSVVRNSKHISQDVFGKVHVYTYAEEDIKPIGDGGTTTIDMQFVRENFLHLMESVDFAASIFNKVLTKAPSVICIEGDDFLHDSRASFSAYLKKLKFRIKNNVYGLKGAGYSNRIETSSRLNRRKFLFLLYCLSIIIPLADSIRLAILHRDIFFALHFFYVYFVIIQILITIIKKMIGIKDSNIQYG